MFQKVIEKLRPGTRNWQSVTFTKILVRAYLHSSEGTDRPHFSMVKELVPFFLTYHTWERD